jgi:hypothetical protein
LRIGVLLVDEGDATETPNQSSHEILVGQIAFQAYALLALTVEEEYRRCRPHASRQGLASTPVIIGIVSILLPFIASTSFMKLAS